MGFTPSIRFVILKWRRVRRIIKRDSASFQLEHMDGREFVRLRNGGNMKNAVEQAEIMMPQKLPLISIIVPVYQVKDYISECVESLLAQTYTNLEILLVDDGSTDGSGEICDRYAERDSRVRVVHQEKQGPSVARNVGLDSAKGEYVAFVDSDDVVLPDFIEVLYRLVKEYQADIAACNYVRCHTDELERLRNAAEKGENPQVICMSSEQMLRQWHGKYKKWETVAWNKLYRKNIFGGEQAETIRFPIGRKLEDVLASHLIVANAERVALTMRGLYLYRIRPGSRAGQSRTVELMNENLRAQRERMAFLRRSGIFGRI